MKITYQDNQAKGPGHGKLVFSEAALPDAPWSVSITRGSDHACLAGGRVNQWVGESVFLPLQGGATPDGALELLLGPAEVNSLDQQEQYLVKLKGASGEPQSGRLRIGAITYSPSETLGNMAQNRLEPERGAVAAPVAGDSAEAEPEPAGPELNMPGPEAVQRGSAKTKIWLYALLAFLALGCAAWFFGNAGKDQPPEARIEDNGGGEKSGGARTPQDLRPDVASGAEERVREFFRRADKAPGAAAELARELPKNSAAEQDAAYRLYYYAAENDEPSILLEYAACLDPAMPQWGSIAKDAPLAWAIYEKALASNARGAREALDRLRAWLEKEAGAGNARAREWQGQIRK